MTEECLIDAILHPVNLKNSQEAVRRNKGCAEIDDPESVTSMRITELKILVSQGI